MTRRRLHHAAPEEHIGKLWEARSNGLCIFRLVTKETMHQRIREAVGR